MALRDFILAASVLSLFLTGCSSRKGGTEKGQFPEKPNIIYILADDLGYGDLGVTGQQKFTTPHIDQLAEAGMMFTRHYAGSTVCAPSRSSLMTGLHTGHTPIRGNLGVKPEGQTPLPAGFLTIAEVLKQQGYVTGAFGKWGLGYPGSEGDPLNQGFDTFFGYICQSLAHRYYPEYLWHDSIKYFLEGNDLTRTVTYAPDVIHQKALAFIEENSRHPFFLYYPLILPHAELLVPEDSIFLKYLGRYAEEPFSGGAGADYGPGMRKTGYCSQEYPRATFAAMVSRLDLYVGDVVGKLEELGLTGNTILMFSSDNGPHREGGADPEFFDSNGPLRGIKRDLYEGGIRMPFIVSWPGVIAGGSKTDHLSAFWDLLPTLADLTGAETPPGLDGISFLPLLLGEKGEQDHDYLYWEFHEEDGRQAVLKDDWKAVRTGVKFNPDTIPELYNLEDDPGEERNIAADHPDIVREMTALMEAARTPSELFNFGR
ncbi:MAG: arylsulfatase [Bacteroidales bacterium]|nr:arylsulfatase [Bacteroidales bacterium]MBN2698831.1 arylsulfatase [Bacteroidales bacterium]